MIKDLKAICRKNGIVAALVLLGFSAVLFYFQRLNIKLFWLTKDLDSVDDKATFCFIVGMAVLMAVVGLWNLIDLFGGRAVRDIHKFLSANSQYAMSDIESDYEQAQAHENIVFVGNVFLIDASQSTTKIHLLKDIAWSYLKTEVKKGVYSYYLVLRTADNKYYTIKFKNKNTVENILMQFGNVKDPIVTGYSEDYKKMYKQDPANFVANVRYM